MDPKKLEALRARFGGNGTGEIEARHANVSGGAAGDIQDPAFRAVADILFNGQSRFKPYEGVPRFLDAPLRLDAHQNNDFSGIDIPLIGVPMDLGVTNRPGSRLGPRAVRQIERIGPYHEVHKIVPMALGGIADIGDVPTQSRYDLAQCHADIEAYYDVIAKAGLRPVSVGGDHSISLPILKALGRPHPVGKGPLGMIHIDAHCDTSMAFEGSKFHHGGPFRQAVLDGVLDPERVIQIGIRGNAEYLWEFSYESGMSVIHAEEFHRMGLDATIARMRAVVGDGPTYLSFDIDSLDPAFAPGTGTPEVGGLSSREAMALIRGAAGLDIIGGDVVEVAPQYDATTNTAQAGAQMLFEIVAVVALALQKSRAR